MISIFNKQEIRERTAELRDGVGGLTAAQKLADLINVGTIGNYHKGRIRAVYEAMHGPLPQPGANERERLELPPVGAVVVGEYGRVLLVCSERDDIGRVFCNTADLKNAFYAKSSNWRAATPKEVEQFLSELPE